MTIESLVRPVQKPELDKFPQKIEPDKEIVFGFFQVCSQLTSLNYGGRVLKGSVEDFRISRRKVMKEFYSQGFIDEGLYDKLVKMNHSR